MKRVPSKFWMIVRIDDIADVVIARAATPTVRHGAFETAREEAQRLASTDTSARGFVILEAIEFVQKSPVTISHPIE